jgi:hypothetical protein
MAVTAGGRRSRDKPAMVTGWSRPVQTTGNTNMNANRNTGMNEIRALSAAELDAVSGGISGSFDFTVAGMHISGGGNPDGSWGVEVEYGNKYVTRFGKV